MSSQQNKLDKLAVKALWPSRGIEIDHTKYPTWGVRISSGKVPPNPHPRVVICLGCNTDIFPDRDAYGCEYKGSKRYVCVACYKRNGFQW